MSPPRIRRTLAFSARERTRIAEACRALGTTFEEFGRVAILHAVDEVEALGREYGSRPLRMPESPLRRAQREQ